MHTLSDFTTLVEDPHNGMVSSVTGIASLLESAIKLLITEVESNTFSATLNMFLPGDIH